MIDIIIPVYNTPIKDLERCLKSIENQTYKDYQVYLIDDGSNQETKEYLDTYLKEKNKVHVEHIENHGVSYARNLGIDISNSKYITFVDADDSIENNFLQESYEIITSNNLDMILGGYQEIKNYQVTRTRLSEKGLHIYEGNSLDYFLEKLLTSKTNENNKELGDSPTGRIYTRLFTRISIGNLRFDTNIHMSEDTLFMIDYMKQVKRIGVVDRVWYSYYQNEYSISNATQKEKLIYNLKGFIEAIKERQKEETKENIIKAYQARLNKIETYKEEINNR